MRVWEVCNMNADLLENIFSFEKSPQTSTSLWVRAFQKSSGWHLIKGKFPQDMTAFHTSQDKNTWKKHDCKSNNTLAGLKKKKKRQKGLLWPALFFLFVCVFVGCSALGAAGEGILNIKKEINRFWIPIIVQHLAKPEPGVDCWDGFPRLQIINEALHKLPFRWGIRF